MRASPLIKVSNCSKNKSTFTFAPSHLNLFYPNYLLFTLLSTRFISFHLRWPCRTYNTPYVSSIEVLLGLCGAPYRKTDFHESSLAAMLHGPCALARDENGQKRYLLSIFAGSRFNPLWTYIYWASWAYCASSLFTEAGHYRRGGPVNRPISINLFMETNNFLLPP